MLKTHRSLTAFTLTELILAVVIMAAILIVCIDMLITATRGNPIGSNLIVAANLAQGKLEEIKNLDYAGADLAEGTGSNPADSFLPALNQVSVNLYPTSLFLTESDYYQVNYGTSGSLTGTPLPGRVDRISQIEWVDDAAGGSAQDYKKITVRVFWSEGNQTKSVTLSSYIYPVRN